MIIALIIRGITLEGSMNGIEYFILKINTEKLKDLEVLSINLKRKITKKILFRHG